MVFLLIGLVYIVFRFDTLDQPPVWDGAMGMTPAAITLASSGFDIVALLEMPDYLSGGANVHSLSLATWFVAASIEVFGSYLSALPFLHLTSFLLVALLGAGVFRAVLRQTQSPSLALLAAAASVSFPPIIAQASDVYLDLPLAVSVVWSFVFAYEERPALSIVLLSIAAAIKPSALIAIPALATYLILTRTDRLKAVRWLAIPLLIALIPWLLQSAIRQRGASVVTNVVDTFGFSAGYLFRMPVLLAIFLAIALIPLAGRLNGRLATMARQDWGTLVSSLVFPTAFFYFILLSPLVSRGVTALPRYTTMFLPILIIGLCVGLSHIASARVAKATTFAVIMVFAFNIMGALEPPSENAFWLAERSLAYEKHLSVQVEAFSAFNAKAATVPAYYDHFASYRIEYPEMGWLEQPVADGTNSYVTPGISRTAPVDLPDEFVILLEAPCCGGPELRGLLRTAWSSPEFDVEVEDFSEGEFRSVVAHIRRINVES